eukprot:c6447_g1_i1.p1 GENE.c6447_g1_i1~~c6447_g1_i1.p1  ORF type:complete len:738 (-),score=203.98 c6447_g1_i1:33-2246(-)
MAQPPQFFVDYKKGEVNEIKMLLRNPATDKDPLKKKDVLKRVVLSMTMGIDMSELFPDMIMCCRTKDVVQKKMIYLYITNYAHADGNRETALLAVNTLQSDCRDEDPMIRGLALRTLCSLRVGNLMEYLMRNVKAGLVDHNAYVRRTAVLGLLKMHEMDPDAINKPEFIEKLYDMIRDRDPQVVVNAINALDEIKYNEGGLNVTKSIVHYLLNRLKDFTDWAQCSVLRVVSRYTPESKEEVFDVMNLLEDTFRNANSALVMAATKVFLNISQSLPNIHEQVLVRLKTPLITLMTSGSDESAYAVLSHLKLLAKRNPDVFTQEYKHFFCRGNDLSCVKQLKVDVLVDVASAINVGDIISELSEYVTDVDVSISRHSIRAIGRIASRLPDASPRCLSALKGFLPLGIDYVAAETVCTLKDILRKHPDAAEIVSDCVAVFQLIDDPEAKVAVTWMIGEFGESVENAPYLLEGLIDSYDDEDAAVKNELLNSSVKLFLKRPAEMRPPLGQLLSLAVLDMSDIDVHDHALFYARLLQHDIAEAQRICLAPSASVSAFTEENYLELQDRLFEEFNTLSIPYWAPSETWLQRKTLFGGPVVPLPNEEEEEVQPAQDPYVDQTPESNPEFLLDPNSVLDRAVFESDWGVLHAAYQFEGTMSQGFSDASQLVASLEELHVKSIAYGEIDGTLKFYFYAAQNVTGAVVMVEVVVYLADKRYEIQIKSRNKGFAAQFGEWLQNLFSQL